SGRLDRSSCAVAGPKLTVLGGFSRALATRTPWRAPSVFADWSGYEYARENNLIAGREDHSDLVLDGLCFDSAGRNQYGEKEGAGISRIPRLDGPIASIGGVKVMLGKYVF